MTFLDADRQLISRVKGDVALVLSEADQYRAVMAFSLRSGGCSPQPFRSLNFSVQQGDSRENVLRNLEVLSVHLKIDPSRIVTCLQVHGDDVAVPGCGSGGPSASGRDDHCGSRCVSCDQNR